MDYTIIPNLLREQEIPAEGTLSRTLFQDDQMKAVLFAFDAGQELSEHKAAVPAVIHVLQGEMQLTLGEDTHDAVAGTWAHMPAQLPHAVLARTPAVMLLLMLRDRR